MNAFELLAERKIAESIARGELDRLPGSGQPLDLEEDRLVPEDLRMAYRILRNSGYVPPEVEQIREIAELERCVLHDAEADDAARARAVKRLSLLKTRVASAYYDRVLDRFS